MEPGGDHGGDCKSDHFQGDNVTLKRGNSALYTLKRLKRDRPDLFEQVISGAMSGTKESWLAAPSKALESDEPATVDFLLTS